MVERGSEDGSIADLPWGTVFDPVVNARALSAIQERGFRAAREVVDRLIQLTDSKFVESAPQSESPPSQTDNDESEPSRAAVDVDGVLESMQGLLGQLASTVRGTLASAQAAGPATFDLRSDNSSGHIALETSEPGVVSSEVWLHNGGPEDMGKVRLRCSDLLAHDGTLIGSSCVHFEPDTVPMPARSSRGITVEVDIATNQQPGTYRGTLLADGHADVWLPVVVVIKSEI